jgi:outer membrane protein OmpA-like peptidoglycan-associated protein
MLSSLAFSAEFREAGLGRYSAQHGRAVRALLALLFAVSVVPLLLRAPAVHAQQRTAVGVVPTADVGGLSEPQGFPRYAGAIIAGGSRAAFDEMVLVTAPLVRVQGRSDGRNNALFLPPEAQKAEGRRTRLVYVIPAGRSPLEVIRGYQQSIRDGGGTAVFECAEAECGGETRSGATSGGGRTGILNLMMPASDVPQRNGDPLQCAVDNNGRTGQRYAMLRLPNDAGHIGVLSYVLGDYSAGSECKAWTGRTVAIVNVIETKAREQRMELVRSDAMGAAMARDGKVTIYAILFDTAKADIKPESQPQIAEMVAYLRANPTLRVLIAGHTDNQGGLDYNTDLSRRRAAAVTSAPAAAGIAAGRLTPQGVGFAAPVATNDTDEGRARNRRVEMVKF